MWGKDTDRSLFCRRYMGHPRSLLKTSPSVLLYYIYNTLCQPHLEPFFTPIPTSPNPTLDAPFLGPDDQKGSRQLLH